MNEHPFFGGWWIVIALMFLWWGPWRRRRWEAWHGRRGRLEGRGREEQPDETIRARLETLEHLESRVSELENRLDFTERLLSTNPRTG